MSTVYQVCYVRIGYAIARRLAQEGAKVLISSRKQNNVDAAVSKLKKEGLCVIGVVCHVANAQHRTNMFDEVCLTFLHCHTS